MKRLCLFGSVLVLAACATAGGGQPLPQMTFAHLQTIPVNVSAITVNIQEANTGGEFVADPAVVTENYFKSRFAPQGFRDSLTVTIEEAQVSRSAKEADAKVARFFDVGGQDVYDVTLRLRVEHVDAYGNRLYGKVFKAWRQMAITEHASIAERERHELQGLEKMFNELDKQITSTVVNEMRLAM